MLNNPVHAAGGRTSAPFLQGEAVAQLHYPARIFSRKKEKSRHTDVSEMSQSGKNECGRE